MLGFGLFCLDLGHIASGLYIVAYSPPPAGGGKKSKDLEMGKEIKGWKNKKMKNIKDFMILAVLKCNI